MKNVNSAHQWSFTSYAPESQKQTNRKGPQLSKLLSLMVELVGVEPTSRQDANRTTTCLVACLFREAAAEATHRTATRSPVTPDAPERSHQSTRYLLCPFTRLSGETREEQRRLIPCIKQPWRSYLRHLKEKYVRWDLRAKYTMLGMPVYCHTRCQFRSAPLFQWTIL